MFEALLNKLDWSYVLVLGLLVYAAYSYLSCRRLRAFPGPALAGWSAVWHTWSILSMRSHEIYADLLEKHGPLVRIGPNELITNDADLVIRMGDKKSAYTRSAWFYTSARFAPGEDNLFSMIDNEKHAARKQQMSPGYSRQYNPGLEAMIDGHVQKFVRLLQRHAPTTGAMKAEPIDFAEKIAFLTLDVTTHLGFGEPVGHLDADADMHGFNKDTNEGMIFATKLRGLGFGPLLQNKYIASKIGPSEKDRKGFGKMVATARSAVSSRLKGDISQRSDLLAIFRRRGLTDAELLQESVLQIIAGSETTANTLRSIMFYLLSNPRVYLKLRKEIDEVVTIENLTSDSIVSAQVARQLPFLSAAIRESQRINPTVTGGFSKRVPDQGDTVRVGGSEVYLPGGTNIGMAVFAMLRDKALFGDDVEMYRPERWLVDDEAHISKMTRVVELQFSTGQFQCLGKPIAYMEIYKSVFEMIRRFDWAFAHPQKLWEKTDALGISMMSDMWVSVSNRT